MSATRLQIGTGTRKDGTPSEGRIMDEIMIALSNEPDVLIFRNNISTAMMPNGAYVAFGVGGKGASDLVGAVRGRAVFVEIKRPGEKQRPEQVRFEALVQRKCCEYVVLTSVAEAMAWLEDMRRKYA